MKATSSPPRLSAFQKQTRLLWLAAGFMTLFTLILTLAPAARARSWAADYRFDHWQALLIWLGIFGLAHWQTRRLSPQIDPYLLPLAALLTGWGMLSIWRLTDYFGLRQSIWLLIAGAIFILGLRFNQTLLILRRYKYLWLTSGLLLTALTLIFGTHPLGIGPRLWLGAGGIYLQPAEPLKLLLVIYLAAYLADRQPFATRWLPLLVPTVVMSGLILLLLLAQRDLGTASIFIFIYTGVLFGAIGQRRVLAAALAVLSAAGVVGYWLFDLIRIRVEAWLNPWLDPSGRSYQIVQSLIAIGTGGLAGRGPGLGSPSLVPISHSDFIFSTIAEETGLAGTLALLMLLGLFSLRGLRIALNAENRYQRYLAIGLSTYVASQSILIIGGNIRLLPLTGVTLPFVSYGGSSLVTSFLALLLLAKISQGRSSHPPVDGDTQPVLQLGKLLLLGITAAALVNGWWAVQRGPDLQTRTDNARRGIADRFVLRGSLLDRQKTPLTVTIGQPGSYQRAYLHPEFAPILGYTHPIYGQAGAEASLDLILRGLENQSPWVIWWDHILYGQPPPGLDAQTSLDLDLQSLATDLLGDTPGAAVVLAADNGEILALASSPSYDPNLLDKTWADLIDAPNSPLFNRATQGSYMPGPILGPFLLAASQVQPESTPTRDQTNGFTYTIDPITLDCAIPPTPLYTWAELTAKGCPADLAELGLLLGAENLSELFQDLGFYASSELRLAQAIPSPIEAIATPSTAALGQGKLRLTPLQLALAAAALNSQGVRPAPHLLLQVQNPTDGWTPYPALGSPTQALDPNQAGWVAHSLAVPEQPFWQSLAVAYTSPEQPLTWFMGGTLPNAERPLVVVVLLESKNPLKAEFIGQQLILSALGD